MATASNSRIWGIILLIIAIFSLSLPAYPKYTGGTGEPIDPYQIATADDLMLLGETPEDYDKHFILTADIDLDPNLPGRKVFHKAIIAPDTDDTKGGFQGTPFTGVLDGNGFTISNLNSKSLEADYTGLFGLVRYGIIKDLRLVDANIDAERGDNVGSLVGYLAHNSILSGCSVQDATVKGGSIVGGLVGNNGHTITNCYSSCIVDGNSAGGLAGSNIGGRISMCYSTGTVSGIGPVGGLVGQNGAWVLGVGEMISLEGYINHCYSTCSVTGEAAVGGLVGFNEVGTITHCYSTGAVSGDERAGGLIGEDDDRVTYCFWDVETSELTVSASGEGKTTTEMQTPITFLSWGACGPFWTIDEGRDYPHLAWENVPGELIATPYGGGKGTAQDPYLIYTAEQLNTIGLSFCDLDKHFKLMADVDLSDFWYSEALIAQGGWWEGTPFQGVFDGNGHTISHLTIVGEDNLGLFGYLGTGAEVRDLGVLDVNIVGSDSFVGALAGYCKGNLIRCYSSGIVSGDWSVGGLVGANSEVVNQCHSTCVVSGNDWLGGLVGNNSSVITQCYSTGGVSGDNRVGGLVGHNSGHVIHCYSTGAVSGSSSSTIGGLVGHDYDYSHRRVTLSFWDMQTSGQNTSTGGMGKITAEMQTASTFLEAGWDFVDETANGTEDIWWILEGQDYPRLWWEWLLVQVVDDFESYNDIDPGLPGGNPIYYTWWEPDTAPHTWNGGFMGYVVPFEPTMETVTVHSGDQSGPLLYNNTGTYTFSEVHRMSLPVQDWTAKGATVLSLWFYGNPANTPGQLYLLINDDVRVDYNGDPDNLTQSVWHRWNVDLTTVGTNLQIVTCLAIGIDGLGAAGTLLLDDIELYASAPAE